MTTQSLAIRAAPIDRSQVRSYVQQRRVRSEPLAGPRDQPVERRRGAERPLSAAQAPRPLGGELVLPTREPKVVLQETDSPADRLDRRRVDDISGPRTGGPPRRSRTPACPDRLRPSPRVRPAGRREGAPSGGRLVPSGPVRIQQRPTSLTGGLTDGSTCTTATTQSLNRFLATSMTGNGRIFPSVRKPPSVVSSGSSMADPAPRPSSSKTDEQQPGFLVPGEVVWRTRRSPP